MIYIYTVGITTRITGRYDDRGNLLTDIDGDPALRALGYNGLATQCNRGSDSVNSDSNTVGEANTAAGTSADGPICFRLPNDT